MKFEILAGRDMLRRYASVIKWSFKNRRSMTPTPRTRAELAFQPAIIELVDSPPSPAPRCAIWLIVGIIVFSLVWSAFAKLDVVAVTSGRVVTDTRTKVVQPLEAAIVRRILVADGDRVRRGQLLISLDAVGVTSDRAQADKALSIAKSNYLRSRALAKALSTGQPLQFVTPLDLPPMAARDALNLAESQYAAFLAKDAGLLAAIKEKQAEMITVEQTVTSLAEYEKIASARVADYQRLLEKKYVSRQEYLIRVQEKIAAGKDLLAQRNRFTELARAVDIAVRDRAANRAETLRSWLDDERSANEQSEQLLKEVGKATDRETSMNLVSPSDGQVQQLAVHSVGGVVTPGQALMSIVPAQESAVAEIQILNQDIGFITPGQAAIAKVSSFPYTRYGYLPAHIVSVSQDSIKDEKQGWVFPAVVALERNSLNVDGKAVKLSPGMDLTVEIRTSHRTVLEYLLDPIKSQVHEGLHER